MMTKMIGQSRAGEKPLGRKRATSFFGSAESGAFFSFWESLAAPFFG
jgi:hypothetical protein